MICRTIDIWEGFEKIDKNIEGVRPTMDTYVLAGDKIRPAILICPGGGYSFTSEREAEQIALKFNAAGFHAFVLYYSVAPKKHPQPLYDVSRAVCLIRENADKYNIDKDKIVVCGFSAGGHLAASLGTLWNKDYIRDSLKFEKGMNKPNGLILCYPVITSGEFAHKGSFTNLVGDKACVEVMDELSLEKQVSFDTPETFIWHTFEDSTVPVENTILFAKALRSQDIPFELHIYPKGGHGLSLATQETGEVNNHVATWMDLCIEWVKSLGTA
ncbi:MAG: alpha/beta hydrolase [Clostridiaceae bacterium]